MSFPSYGYSSLGCNCKTHTIALTSNEKYLYPTDDVYYDFYPLNRPYKNIEKPMPKKVLENPNFEIKSKCNGCRKQ